MNDSVFMEDLGHLSQPPVSPMTGSPPGAGGPIERLAFQASGQRQSDFLELFSEVIVEPAV